MYNTILVHVDDSARLDARLQAAALLANAQGAHLVGCAATGASWPAYAVLASSIAVDPLEEFEALRALARTTLARFEERVRLLGVQSVEQRLVDDDDRHAMVLQARYADLVVLGRNSEEQNTVRGLPQFVALHTARPVLVVPTSYAGAPIAGTVVVGWDGSMPALRAITGALPLLAMARAVRLALVNPERESGLQDDESGAAMGRYLARHGVPVEVVAEHTTEAPGDALLRLAHASGAGLLVSGAFGHSRYREIVLGGVTRILLERAAIPVLLAH